MKYESMVVEHSAFEWPELQVYEGNDQDPCAAIGLNRHGALYLWFPGEQELDVSFPTTFEAILAAIRNSEAVHLLQQASEQNRYDFIRRLNAVMA